MYTELSTKRSHFVEKNLFSLYAQRTALHYQSSGQK